MTRAEEVRRVRAALEDAGHRNSKKEYVLWPPRSEWPKPSTPSDGQVNEACDELGCYPTLRDVLNERRRRTGREIVEVYLSKPIGWGEWELDDNVEIDVERNEYTRTGVYEWLPIPRKG